MEYYKDHCTRLIEVTLKPAHTGTVVVSQKKAAAFRELME